MGQRIKSPYDIDDLEAESRYWNGPYWLDDAVASDNHAVAASEDAATAGRNHSCISTPLPDAVASTSRLLDASNLPDAAYKGAPGTQLSAIVCTSIDSIPGGRQSSKILKCGIAGCTSDKLFDRKYELQRHMEGHQGRNYPCLEPGCPRTGDKAFARADKRNEHMTKVHGH
ncbi:hypothetical protein LTR37_011588 [Vermiconidia calcicola]|uniref:Uncharacterized protein n=1 Tax=Vermiconidia calcicola TaxID=1690605 RepID=A0ACC3N1L6_9PEZI|nr:hypothetical protein LTR37_011588 [Vermiconidia calcicola]